MTEAILFDNDDVLVDTETLFYETTRAAFARLGVELTRTIWGTRYLAEGGSSREIALSMGADPGRVAEVLEDRNREYRRALAQPPPLRPQARATVAALHGRVKLAIVTGCGREQLNQVHAATGLLSFFGTIVTSDDCSCAKPHPEPYLAALQGLGVPAGRCVAVEDSPRGLASARAAGIPCVVVPSEMTRGLDFPGAMAVEKDLSGLLNHVRLERRGL